MTTISGFTVLCCRDAPADSPSGDGEPVAAGPGLGSRPSEGDRDAPVRIDDDRKSAATIRSVLGAFAPHDVQFVGRRPGKPIDELLHGRLLIVGDDADLAAVARRLLRKELLGSVEVAFAAAHPTPFARLWDLPIGAAAVRLATHGEVDLVPLVRDDVGGVLVGAGELGPLNGTVYVDERRVLRGPALRLHVEPDREKGLVVTVTTRRFAGVGRRPRTTPGRAVQVGTVATTVVSDGITYPRRMTRWTFYKHTQPLRLVRGLV